MAAAEGLCRVEHILFTFAFNRKLFLLSNELFNPIIQTFQPPSQANLEVLKKSPEKPGH